MPRKPLLLFESQNDLHVFRDEAALKVHVHTWLAWQEDPGRPMGYAVGRGFLDPRAASAAALVAWVRRLFVLTDA